MYNNCPLFFFLVTRGRGFTRTPPSRGDLFRSRPPNTSRPPSLHVDDFLALETCGAQPTGPTGYNKLSREIINIRGTRGGRGRGNFGGDRGRLNQMGSGTPQGVYRQTYVNIFFCCGRLFFKSFFFFIEIVEQIHHQPGKVMQEMLVVQVAVEVVI